MSCRMQFACQENLSSLDSRFGVVHVSAVGTSGCFTDQLRKMYGFDRKSKLYWLRLFFQFFDYAVNNAYLLYKHGCIAHNICAKDLLGFRLELVHMLLKIVGSKAGRAVQKTNKV